MQLHPVAREDVALSKPLAWALFDVSGKRLFKAGESIADPAQLDELLAVGLYRDAAGVRKSEEVEREQVLTFEQIKLNVGDSLQLQPHSGEEGQRYYVSLIGYLKGQGIIVSMPLQDGKLALVREGASFVVRCFGGKSAYAFTSIARKVTSVPFPHIYLTYPKEVRGAVVRRCARAKVNIVGSVLLQSGQRMACVVRDISVGGALLAARGKMANIGETFLLNLRVKVNSGEHILDLNCIARSVHVAQGNDDKTPSMMHGVSFVDLASMDSLVLTALLYNNLLSEQEIPA
jgi:c-di-GMP-binding flagellar brake protein YcgR